jgi:hypothetical protein
MFAVDLDIWHRCNKTMFPCPRCSGLLRKPVGNFLATKSNFCKVRTGFVELLLVCLGWVELGWVGLGWVGLGWVRLG